MRLALAKKCKPESSLLSKRDGRACVACVCACVRVVDFSGAAAPEQCKIAERFHETGLAVGGVRF